MNNLHSKGDNILAVNKLKKKIENFITVMIHYNATLNKLRHAGNSMMLPLKIIGRPQLKNKI